MEVIQSITRERRKVRVMVGGETIIITASQLEERPLREGDLLDLEEYDQWLLLRQYRPALNYAVSLLAQRAYATGEVEQKLRRIGFRPVTIEMVLYKLTSNDLMNDTEFAMQWAGARANHRLGPARIAQELRRKGISREDTEQAVAALTDEAQLEAAAALAERSLTRGKAGEDPHKIRQRTMAMLARRGYGYDIARKAIALAARRREEE